jgi:hypothetical protein
MKIISGGQTGAERAAKNGNPEIKSSLPCGTGLKLSIEPKIKPAKSSKVKEAA